MKTSIKILLFVSVLLAGFFSPAFSDEPAPPLPPSGHGFDGNQGPAGAPIDGGLGILIALGIGYGGKRYLQARKTGKEITTQSGAGSGHEDL